MTTKEPTNEERLNRTKEIGLLVGKKLQEYSKRIRREHLLRLKQLREIKKTWKD